MGRRKASLGTPVPRTSIVPYKVPAKKGKKKEVLEAKEVLRRKVRPGNRSGDAAASSVQDGGEDEDEDKDGEDDAPDGGDDDRPQPDQVLTNGRSAGQPTAANTDQAETHQAAAPPPEASTSAGLSDPAAAPLA